MASSGTDRPLAEAVVAAHDGAVAPGTSSRTALPVRAVLLGRRVRTLVAVTLTHALVLGGLTWAVGGGLSGPGAVGLVVHVAVSLAAALPVWWQFAGDPVARERRAVRAMAVSFAGLAVYSAVDAVRDAAAPPLPGEPVVGAVLALLVTAALVALAARERRGAPEAGPGGADDAPAPAASGGALLLAATVLVAAAVSDLLAATSVGGPAVSAVVAVLAAREALLARTWTAARSA